MNTCDAIQRNCQQRGDVTALADLSVRLTWVELRDRISRLAGGLKKMGCRPCDRVIILANNAASNVEMTYAVQWIGSIIVPLNTRWTSAEIEFSIEDSGAKIVMLDRANLERFLGIRQELRSQLQILFAGSSEVPQGMVGYEGVIESSAVTDFAETTADSVASLFYTGGTTGRSKGVLLTHGNHVAHSQSLISECALHSDIRYLHSAPMFHIADSLFTHVITALGGTHVVLGTFSPQALAHSIECERITDTILVPTMIQMVLSDAEAARKSFEGITRLFYGASPMPQTLLAALVQSYPELKLIQLYGQTESSPVLTVLPSERHVLDGPNSGKTASAGRAMTGTEVRIRATDSREARPMEIGEIVARGPQIMKGYWNRQTETESALKDGWLHTGDAGFIDGEGFIFVTDRIKDMIITGGENVYSVEVEQAIYQVDGVAQCCVIGIPHEKWGESVHAVVVTSKESRLTVEMVMRHCESHLADFKRPRSVDIRHDPLPVSGAGKILKRELRDAYANRSRSAALC